MVHNKIEHRRATKTKRIEIKSLKSDPEFQFDPQFMKLQVALLKQKIDVALTRLPTSSIKTGFYIRSGGKNEHISNYKPELLDQIVPSIRGGNCFPVEVYWSHLNPADVKWVCPDHENILAAYRFLGISLVPARILKPRDTHLLPEGAVWIGGAGDVAEYKRAVAPYVDSYASFLKEKPQAGNAQLLLRTLQQTCENVRGKLRDFHVEPTDSVHYHQMLHAVVARHERALDTSAQLLGLGRPEHAAAIVRLAYEAFLNFYLDWLSPTFFGPRMQLLSYIRTVRANLAQGDTDSTLGDAEAKLGGFQSLMETASKKAAISPLGNIFHGAAYPPLSSIMHQTYGRLEPEAITFDACPDPQEQEYLTKSLVRWMDFITAALLIRVSNDIGLDLP